MTAPALQVSVIIPIYNSLEFLTDTLESVLGQTFSDWEVLLVVDKKSSDHSNELAQGYVDRDPRFRRLIGPGGVAANRNLGIENARGRYLAFLDSDDLWRPNKLAAQLELMRQKNSPFSYHSTQFLSEDGLRHGRKFIVPPSVNKYDLLKTNYIGCSTVILDKTAFKDIVFPPLFHEDMRLWLQLLKQVKTAVGNPEVLGDYRVRDNQVSANKSHSALHRWQIICEHEENKLRRLVSFAAYAVNGYIKHRNKFNVE